MPNVRESGIVDKMKRIIGKKAYIFGSDVSITDQLVLDPEFNAFKIVATGSGTLTAIDNSAQGTWTMADQDIIAHGLGYLPTYLLYISRYADTYRKVTPGLMGWGASDYPFAVHIDSYVDAINFVVRCYVKPNANPPDKTIYYRYYLLREIAT